jgi:hypothetical protein
MDTLKRKTRKNRINIVSASAIIKAGGVDAYVKRIGYDSSKIKLSGAIPLTDAEMKDILKMLKK